MTKKILVVDDEEDIRIMLERLLENEGYDVSLAGEGKEALAILKKEKVDLALLDFFMPGMSGRELAELIRKDIEIKDTKLAFLTVDEFNLMEKEEMKKLNIRDYIQEPFDNEDLRQRIKNII
jgi:CheY-like chemotaxis protein